MEGVGEVAFGKRMEVGVVGCCACGGGCEDGGTAVVVGGFERFG